MNVRYLLSQYKHLYSVCMTASRDILQIISEIFNENHALNSNWLISAISVSYKHILNNNIISS